MCDVFADVMHLLHQYFGLLGEVERNEIDTLIVYGGLERTPRGRDNLAPLFGSGRLHKVLQYSAPSYAVGPSNECDFSHDAEE